MMATQIMIQQGRPSNSICRLCFMEHEHYQSIFEGDHADLAEWIGDLTSLKLVNVPNAPASLCLECKSTLEDFESFREMCFTNDRVFKEMFLQNDSQAKEMAYSLDFLAEREIKIERIESQETGSGGSIVKEECSIDSVCPEVESNDIKEEFEDITIEIEKNTPDCEKKTDAKTTKRKKSKKRRKEEQPVQCKVCSKIFTTKEKLRFHIRYHNKKHFCSYCNKAFRGPDHLKVHIRTHTGEKPFKCDQCDKSYTLRKSLNSHVLKCHAREYLCDLCDVTFSTPSDLKHHKQSKIHRTDRHSYFCEVCNVKFSTSDDLDYHKSVFCGASINTPINLRDALSSE